MRRFMSPAVFAVALCSSVPALAQTPTCPPGAWFCEENSITVNPPGAPPAAPRPAAQPAPAAPAAPADPPLMPPPADQPAPPQAPTIVVRPATPPTVIYEPPGTRIIIVRPGVAPPPPPPPLVRRLPPPPPRRRPPPPPPPPRWRPEIGLNFRAEGIMMGHAPEQRHFDSGMGGVGASLLYRPTPHFAFEAGFDVLGGRDYNGFERTETPFSLGGRLYLNPRSRFQLYLLAGGTLSHAKVSSQNASPTLTPDGNEYGASYSYIGGQGGAGAELRLSRHFALNLDALGFVRTRIDGGPRPEFINAEGQTSNTSGGGVVRGGLTLWW